MNPASSSRRYYFKPGHLAVRCPSGIRGASGGEPIRLVSRPTPTAPCSMASESRTTRRSRRRRVQQITGEYYLLQALAAFTTSGTIQPRS